MPIELDKLTAGPAAASSQTPKFFSKELTGSGKSVGLINQTLRPGRSTVSVSAFTSPHDEITRKMKTTAGAITTHMIPMAPLLAASLRDNRDKGLTMAVPHVDDRFHVTANAPKLDFDVFVDLTPQGIIFYEDSAGDKITKELNLQYRMEVYVVDKAQPSDAVTMIDYASRSRHKEFAIVDWSYTPLDHIEDLIKKATAGRGVSGHSVSVNIDDLAEWMSEYDVHERICRLADFWASDELADMMAEHIKELFVAGTPPTAALNQLAYQLRYLETYNVSLEAYRQIHTALSTICTPDVALMFSKQNLSLLMSHTLEHLNQIKPQLSAPPQAAAGAAVVPAHFSNQQRNAVTTDEPLVLVQAGAGTGKSTVILGRIDHLASRGVNPKDITVLSFTNAAADNIIAKNPNVGSMTISRMIHDIYTANYPQHELSSIDTIINSLDIFYPKSDLAAAFRKRLIDVDKNANGAFTAMNTFIEAHFDDVMAVLDRIGQTSLELEIIVCYQKIETMMEPAHVQSRYLIIDEVQDNSIFEFIYVLKYVAKHKENMYIVGDSSQTLYEFRSSNPKALNALEGSGVFSTFKLSTNYRSNQEILDFANVSLADIEANQYANMQLQANSLALPTAASFAEKVTVDYRPYPRITAFNADLPGIIRTSVREYIDGCLARGEQVAFLAFSRRQVTAMEEVLTVMYPGRNIANLVSDKSYSTTVFSEFIKKFWNDVCQVSPANASFTVTQEIIKKLDQLTRNADKAEKAVIKMMQDWWLTNSAAINGWVALCGAGQMTSAVFFDNLRQCLLDYEIRHNSIKQSLMNQKNKERKEKNLASKSDLVVSTIHGCKGLEFDNVVVVHKYDSQMDEAAKRMYYVAFTRAMNTEYILSYGTVKNARIETDHKLLLTALEERDALNAARVAAVGSDPTIIDGDADEEALIAAAAAGVDTDADDAAAALAPVIMLSPADLTVSTGADAASDDADADQKDGVLAGAVA
ncbi:UvrD-helicase domain-containing protein [Arthrobacter sp. ES1]|uniref:UvrD-helicase domain-containing protein n=1 Tax=Arthrobacter sp. ES1 TaxID=1897056 RepID=UPI001CFFE7F7|nr:UvrD-helicase domain-containing protein [Arthrobacter sp. ES1]MCB5280643.1 ATP-dependent DNA helicase PcrA [Arthrobacter sp. ES1]